MSSSKHPYKRRKKVIDFVSQLNIAIEILMHVVMFVVLILILIYVEPFATMFSNQTIVAHQEALHWLIDINVGKWPLIFLALLFLTMVSVFFSHRIMGPAYKLTMMIKKYGSRDLSQQTVLRKYDYLDGLVKPMNELRDRYVQDIMELRKEIDSSLNNVGRSSDSVKGSLEKCQALLKEYKLPYDVSDEGNA